MFPNNHGGVVLHRSLPRPGFVGLDQPSVSILAESIAVSEVCRAAQRTRSGIADLRQRLPPPVKWQCGGVVVVRRMGHPPILQLPPDAVPFPQQLDTRVVRDRARIPVRAIPRLLAEREVRRDGGVRVRALAVGVRAILPPIATDRRVPKPLRAKEREEMLTSLDVRYERRREAMQKERFILQKKNKLGVSLTNSPSCPDLTACPSGTCTSTSVDCPPFDCKRTDRAQPRCALRPPPPPTPPPTGPRIRSSRAISPGM